MAESLTAHQRVRILELGTWRDEGRLFAVGKDGEVSKHLEDQKEISNGHARKGTAGREGATGWEGTAASGSAAASEPSREVGREGLIAQYKAHLREVRLYFAVTVIETDEGIWIIAPMWPIGKDGPRLTVALYLPGNRIQTPTAFGLRSSGLLARPISKKHTNSPEGSICAWSDGDIEWAPGDSPFLLLRLYSEWLLCQLFYQCAGFWPGRQSGIDAVYRWNEFKPNEWCDCGSQKRYGECHQPLDLAVVTRLKSQGKSVAAPIREMPPSVLRFARTGWRKPPPAADLPIRPFTTSD